MASTGMRISAPISGGSLAISVSLIKPLYIHGRAAFLSVATPGIYRTAYFLEIAEVLAASPDGPPDKGAMFAVMQRHGLTPALPGPLAAPAT
jgi:hypothetical protein